MINSYSCWFMELTFLPHFIQSFLDLCLWTLFLLILSLVDIMQAFEATMHPGDGKGGCKAGRAGEESVNG